MTKQNVSLRHQSSRPQFCTRVKVKEGRTQLLQLPHIPYSFYPHKNFIAKKLLSVISRLQSLQKTISGTSKRQSLSPKFARIHWLLRCGGLGVRQLFKKKKKSYKSLPSKNPKGVLCKANLLMLIICKGASSWLCTQGVCCFKNFIPSWESKNTTL